MLFTSDFHFFLIQIFLKRNNYLPVLFSTHHTFLILNFLSCSFLSQNIFFYKDDSFFLDSYLQDISFFFYFTILEPEWEALFYTFLYSNRYINFHKSLYFQQNFNKKRNLKVYSLKLLNMLALYQNKFFIFNVSYVFILQKYIFYTFYIFNRKILLDFSPKNYSELLFTKKFLLYFFFLNIFFNSFDFFVSLFLIGNLIIREFFYIRFSFLFLFVSKKSLVCLIYKIKQLLFFNFRLFSFDLLSISNLECGFTFLGFNFSISTWSDKLRIVPVKFSVLYFLKFFRQLIFFNINTSA